MTVRVVRNDWSAVTPPELGRWRPSRSVSVVIPAYRCQQSLDLTLASLAHQTYPQELLEVVVVDDNSDPPLRLSGPRPARTRLLRPDQGWGRANALHHGAAAATGDILHWLDADMLVYPEHVEAQARWHHRLPYAVTLGWKRFVDVRPGGPDWPAPDQVAQACATGGTDQLFAHLPSTGHDYVEQRIAGTDQLRLGDHLSFLAHVGATAALSRELYEATGGLDTGLRLGEDTEFGYRLAQAGAVFIPEPAARAWHLGPTHMMRHQRELQRYNRPFLADRMPHPRWLRRVGGTGWSVPLVVATVIVDGQPLERVRAAVDAVLASDPPDLRVDLVGPWHELSDRRHSPLADPWLDLRLTAATYHGDPRVRLVTEPPTTAYPSPYLLTVPVGAGLSRPALRRLVDHADQQRLGLVRVPVGRGGVVELWRTSARHRADRVRGDGEPLAAVVAELHGADDLDPAAVGVLDLSERPVDDLADRRPVVPAEAARTGWQPGSVEVAGLRSWVRATRLVARLAWARLTGRLRRFAAAGPSRPDTRSAAGRR